MSKQRQPLTVRQIVADRLKADGYDGLFCSVGDCGCVLDDLMPCCESCEHCEAGFRGPDPDGECTFRIYPTREAAAKAAEEAP